MKAKNLIEFSTLKFYIYDNVITTKNKQYKKFQNFNIY